MLYSSKYWNSKNYVVNVDELTRMLIANRCLLYTVSCINCRETGQRPTKFVHRCFKRAHQHLDLPMPAWRMDIVGWLCPITTWRYTYTIRNVISGVTAPKFTNFLYDIAAVSMPFSRWRYCILFRNVSAKTGSSQIRRMQKTQINWLP